MGSSEKNAGRKHGLSQHFFGKPRAFSISHTKNRKIIVSDVTKAIPGAKSTTTQAGEMDVCETIHARMDVCM